MFKSELIEGREYNHFNTEEEQKMKGFVMGESDLVVMTRSLGIINIEVKGINSA